MYIRVKAKQISYVNSNKIYCGNNNELWLRKLPAKIS